MVNPRPLEQGVIELHWGSYDGITSYGLYERLEDGQLRFLEATEAGPFDTSVEIAQWAVRVIARRVPPARC